MSLGGAIVTQYTDSDAAADLRSALGGTGRVYGDRAKTGLAMPYVVFTEISSSLLSQGKDNSYRLVSTIVQFDCWTTTRAETESVLDSLETAYIGEILSIDGSTHLETYFSNRLIMVEPDQSVYRGMLELDFRLQR